MSRQEDKLLQKVGPKKKKEEKQLFNWKKFLKLWDVEKILSFFKRQAKIGNISDPKCKRSQYSNITRKTCRTQCREWDGEKCRLGY